jgi:hypothetical protein
LIASAEPLRVKRIDGNRDAATVHAAVWREVEEAWARAAAVR